MARSTEYSVAGSGANRKSSPEVVSVSVLLSASFSRREKPPFGRTSWFVRHTSYVSPAYIFSCDCLMARTYASRFKRGAKNAAAASPSAGSGSTAIDRARRIASDAKRGPFVSEIADAVETVDAHASTARSVSAIQNRAFSSASSLATRRTPSAAATAADARPFRFSFVRNCSTYV